MQDRGVSRRELLAAGGSLTLLALAAPARVEALLRETARGAGRGRFLDAGELAALRAACDRLLPGPPGDPGPGALEARAPEAIDLFLGAFEVDPPLIHAGGPFSDRAGARHDDFADFHALDRQAELGWRIRLEGSRGKRSREFAGPVVGLQEIYRTGLARLDALARRRGAASFAAAPVGVQDAVLAAGGEPLVSRLVDVALVHALEATLGPPEYGGNHALVGWRRLSWPGDNQPDGFTRAQVTTPDPPDPPPPATLRAHAAALRALGPELGGRRADGQRWWASHRGLGR
jgi:hypothetical protein